MMAQVESRRLVVVHKVLVDGEEKEAWRFERDKSHLAVPNKGPNHSLTSPMSHFLSHSVCGHGVQSYGWMEKSVDLVMGVMGRPKIAALTQAR